MRERVVFVCLCVRVRYFVSGFVNATAPAWSYSQGLKQSEETKTSFCSY